MSCTLRMRDLLIMLALVAGPVLTAAVHAAPGWADSLEAGVRQAQTSGKPLMVVFRCVR
jgi:hypothetical protein